MTEKALVRASSLPVSRTFFLLDQLHFVRYNERTHYILWSSRPAGRGRRVTGRRERRPRPRPHRRLAGVDKVRATAEEFTDRLATCTRRYEHGHGINRRETAATADEGVTAGAICRS